MAELCLFCNNNSGSREHLWPKWIHERVDFGPLKMDRYGLQQIIIPDPEITVKSVCGTCNNGWMSDLETASIPIIGSMLNNLSITLDREQQEKVAAWCIKTSMVLDSTRPKEAGERFYVKDDCIKMRESLTIPPKTRVWIGSIETKHLLALGTDTRYSRDDPRDPHTLSSVATIVVGHFVAQVITQRRLPSFADVEIPDTQPRGDNWETHLTQIWPILRDWITWPPQDSFTNGGPDGIAYLMDRWRITTTSPYSFSVQRGADFKLMMSNCLPRARPQTLHLPRHAIKRMSAGQQRTNYKDLLHVRTLDPL